MVKKNSTAKLVHFFLIGRKKVFFHPKIAILVGFWDEIPYLGVKFPVLKPLLG
jgi:hypothetical protein